MLGAQVVGELAGLVAEQSLKVYRPARIRMHHNISEQRQRVDGLHSREGRQREPDFATDQEVLTVAVA